MNTKPHLELRQGLIFYHTALVAVNGQTLLTSETYYSRSNALRALLSQASQLNLNWIDTTVGETHMKNIKLLIGVILAMTVINIEAQNINPEVKDSWVSFAQDMKDAGNLTIAVSPSYAPDLKDKDGNSDSWGAGLSLTYRIPADGILGHTFAGVQLDYIGSQFLSVGIAGGLKGNFQVKGQNFDIGAYAGTVKAVSGSDTTEWGLMTGTFVKTTVKSWDSVWGLGPGRLDVGCAVEKWDRFDGIVIRPGIAFSIVFK